MVAPYHRYRKPYLGWHGCSWLFSGIEPLEHAPARHQLKTNTPVDPITSVSMSTIESQLSHLANRIESLNLNMQSTINESIGCALAVQARRSSNIDLSSQTQRDLYVPHPSLTRMLRTFLANPMATFKTPEQAEAIEFVLAYERHLLLVGPTAMGKTLAYMLPAANRQHGTTCVLLPLSALHTDFDRRCKGLDIPSSRWTPENDTPSTRIVYVSPEHAQTKHFIDYLTELHHLGQLKQFVIDEVHLVKSQSHFRFCFSALKPLLRCGEFIGGLGVGLNLNEIAGVPFLLMTATCPPPLRTEITSILGVEDCHVIHAPTDRPEISYRVKVFPTLNKAKEELVVKVKSQLGRKEPDSFRGLVFCRSKSDVDEVAETIGCDAFHAGLSLEERNANFKNWVDGKNEFMVCSSLMGCGIDVEGVTTVYHFGTPWSILDFVQESGRAGRSGKPSLSMVFAAMDEREPDEEEDVDLYGKHVMRDWVLQNSACRRIALSSFLDHGRTTCTLLKGAVLCDVCAAESLKDHPARLVSFPTLAVFSGGNTNPIVLPTVPPSSLEYSSSAEHNQWVFS